MNKYPYICRSCGKPGEADLANKRICWNCKIKRNRERARIRLKNKIAAAKP